MGTLTITTVYYETFPFIYFLPPILSVYIILYYNVPFLKPSVIGSSFDINDRSLEFQLHTFKEKTFNIITCDGLLSMEIILNVTLSNISLPRGRVDLLKSV